MTNHPSRDDETACTQCIGGISVYEYVPSPDEEQKHALEYIKRNVHGNAGFKLWKAKSDIRKEVDLGKILADDGNKQMQALTVQQFCTADCSFCANGERFTWEHVKV
jgi:hypothetical protein